MTLHRRVLLVPHGMHSFLELLPVAKALLARGCSVLLYCEGYLEASATELCARHGIELLGAAAERDGEAAVAATKPVPATGLRRFLRRLPALRAALATGWDFLLAWRHGVVMRRLARSILRSARPDVVVCFNDRSGDVSAHLLALGRDRGMRTILSPHEAINDGLAGAASFRRDSDYVVAALPWTERLIGELLAWCGYRVYADSEGTQVYWQLPSVVAAQALFGAASRNPWVRGGNDRIDYVAAAAEHYRELLIEAGVPPGRVVTTGYTRHDELAAACDDVAALRRKLHARYSVPMEAEILVFGLPFIAQYVYTSRDGLMSDLTHAIDELQRLFPAAYILLARHPRTASAEIAPLSRGSRCILLDDMSTYQAIAVATIYLCSFSGTSYAALAAARCLLSFDFYHTKTYAEFIGWTDDALHAYSREDFSRCLAQLADPGFRARRLAKIAGHATRYGRLDGRCTERFAALILHERRGAQDLDTVVPTEHPDDVTLPPKGSSGRGGM